LPRKKKKIYKNIVLKNVKSFEDLPSNVAIRIEKGVGGRRTFRYVNEAICTAIEKGEDKPWGYITIAKPSEFEGECDGAYIAKILESDNDWGPLLLKIAIEWASKNNDGLIADRFRVTEFEYHLWNHLLGNQGGDLFTKPVTLCLNKSSKTWSERLSIEEDKIATSFIFFSKTNMLKQLLRDKRIC
tara:strand:+ start:264 stop:821 length:558 start_codon:yes stop_codon:yes gene_type:complete